MKKYIVGGVLVLAVVLYIVFTNSNSGTTNVAPTPTTGSVTAGPYKDGTYTGTLADAIYGPLQVVAVISGGKITDVQLPQYPQAPGHTAEVNGMALPILKQEAIAAQSAQVNIVSGATQTSEAFQQSLASALSGAKA